MTSPMTRPVSREAVAAAWPPRAVRTSCDSLFGPQTAKLEAYRLSPTGVRSCSSRSCGSGVLP